MAAKIGSREGRLGQLVREYRASANLTQEELAERSGLSVQAIGALERGDRRSPRPSTIELLAGALKLDAHQKQRLIAAARQQTPKDPSDRSHDTEQDAPAELTDALTLLASLPVDGLPPHAVLPAGSRMPLAANRLFVGRTEELLALAATLKGASATVGLGQVVVSTGMGGLGKTQLAAEFVHRYGRFFAGGVYWLSCASADEIPLQVAACGGPGAMDLAPGMESRSLEERLQRVQRAWQGAVPRLLVFDNCEEEGLLEAWRPPTGGCRLLVTSRRSHWSPTLGVTALPLDLLRRPDSIQLLRKYRSDLASDDPRLDTIAHELGNLPLALHLAGSYLRDYREEVGLDGYLDELRRSEIVKHSSLLGAGLRDSPSPTHHVQGVAQTFALCLGRLDRGNQVDRAAIALLARMACMAPGEPVPRDLLAKTLKDVDPRRRRDGLRRLGAVGLVEQGEGCLRLHRLVVHFVREQALDPTALPDVAGALIGCGHDAERGELSGAPLAAVIPHLVDLASRDPGAEARPGELCDAVGQALNRAGDLRAARPWFQRAVEVREGVLGPDHPDTVTSLSSLAGLLVDQGQLAAARPLLERAVAVRERLLGPDHPDSAQGIDKLAFLLRAQGEFVAARPLFERALGVRERVLGPDHRDTATSLDNLARLLRDQGELAAARPLSERAVETWQRVLGPDHPDTVTGLNNLALLLRAQGELAAAQPLFERALAVRERVLGPDHQDTAASLNNLALLLRDQGEVGAARPLFERALATWERVLGPHHPHIARGLDNLAGLLVGEGDLVAARALYERALAIREHVLGPDHPDTAQGLNNVAAVLQLQGEPAAARPLYERALETWTRGLGPNHPNIARGLNNLARLLRDQGEPAAARPLMERALAIRECVLGPEHPETAQALKNLALVLQDLGELAAARPLLERALAIRECVLGPDHPDAVATRTRLAELMAAEAEGLHTATRSEAEPHQEVT